MKPHSTHMIGAVLIAIVALTLQVGGVAAQTSATLQSQQSTSHSVIDERTYRKVLDIVFPRDEPSDRTLWAIVLRFRPNSLPESQIVIRRGPRKTEIVEYTPADGSIYSSLNEALDRGIRRDAVELAKGIRVTRREVSVPHVQVKRWHATLFDSIPGTTKTVREALQRVDNTGVESFVLHGSVYELWYAQGLQEVSTKLYDVDLADGRLVAEFKLVQWMENVRRDVHRIK